MVDDAFGATAAQGKPSDTDPFQAGDYVIYPTHGIGKVDRIGTEEIAGHQLDLIYISFDETRMTLRVPVAQARTVGLRKLATPAAMQTVVKILSGRPRTSRMMWAKRAQEFMTKINSGDLRSLAEVVRDLHSGANGAAPSYSQRNLFELAIDRLAGEYAGVIGTDKPTAIEKLTRVLQEGRQAAKAEPAADAPAGNDAAMETDAPADGTSEHAPVEMAE
jgi:CarD family transcriptional regulator